MRFPDVRTLSMRAGNYGIIPAKGETMEITKTQNGTEVTLKLMGCLDTAATPDFAAAIEATEGASGIEIDMSELEFIASSALRQLVATKKKRGADYPITLTGLNDVVREVFDVTGLDEVFTIK